MFNVMNAEECNAFELRLRKFFEEEGFQEVEVTREFGGRHSHWNNTMDDTGTGGVDGQLLVVSVKATYHAE